MQKITNSLEAAVCDCGAGFAIAQDSATDNGMRFDVEYECGALGIIVREDDEYRRDLVYAPHPETQAA